MRVQEIGVALTGKLAAFGLERTERQGRGYATAMADEESGS